VSDIGIIATVDLRKLVAARRELAALTREHQQRSDKN
jgi:hypothetical protein